MRSTTGAKTNKGSRGLGTPATIITKIITLYDIDKGSDVLLLLEAFSLQGRREAPFYSFTKVFLYGAKVSTLQAYKLHSNNDSFQIVPEKYFPKTNWEETMKYAWGEPMSHVRLIPSKKGEPFYTWKCADCNACGREETAPLQCPKCGIRKGPPMLAFYNRSYWWVGANGIAPDYKGRIALTCIVNPSAGYNAKAEEVRILRSDSVEYNTQMKAINEKLDAIKAHHKK